MSGMTVLVPFSCRGRGFCPACIGRRMAERSTALVDRVIPKVATRQWVLTVPWRRRWLLARHSVLARRVLHIALTAIERFYRRATGRSDGRSGAVTVIQRFGSSLALNLHFHILHLDGVFVRAPDRRLSFRTARPRTRDVEALVASIAVAAERLLARLDASDEGDDPDDPLGVLQQASLAGREALGPRAGRALTRVRWVGGREQTLPPRCAAYEGYNLHAGVAFRACDRRGLERLLRYALRPPLAKGRLSVDDDGTVVLGLKRAWSDHRRTVRPHRLRGQARRAGSSRSGQPDPVQGGSGRPFGVAAGGGPTSTGADPRGAGGAPTAEVGPPATR